VKEFFVVIFVEFVEFAVLTSQPAVGLDVRVFQKVRNPVLIL